MVSRWCRSDKECQRIVLEGEIFEEINGEMTLERNPERLQGGIRSTGKVYG